MTLHPELEKMLQQNKASGTPTVETLTPEDARRLLDVDRRKLGAHPAHQYNTTTDTGITVRIYRSPNTPEKDSGALVYYHGGGFVKGSLNSYDEWCRYLANESACVVISVDYRLAPEHPFPTPIEDAWDALNWVVKQHEMLGIARERIAVGGDSAGGNLASVMAIMVRETPPHLVPSICHQVLIYPVTDLTTLDTASYKAYGNGEYGLSRAGMAWYKHHYIGNKSAMDWRISPLHAPHHRHLTPAFIITAECDVLRDEGEAYARALMFGGNTVTLKRYEGMIHGFVTAYELDCTQEPREHIAKEIRRILRPKRA